MADSGSVDASNEVFSSVSTQEKVLKNKRKYLAEFAFNSPIDVPLSLTEFPRYELLAEKFQNTESNSGPVKAQSNWPKEEQDEEDSELVDWDDPIASQLEELLVHALCMIFKSGIKKITECGYSEQVAEQAILRSGLCYGNKDPVSNIVDNVVVSLQGEKEFDASNHHVFENLDTLVEYTMLEMIHVLREVKPSLSIVEAMWFLLICDLNLSLACAAEGDSLSGFNDKENPKERESSSEVQTSEASGGSSQNPSILSKHQSQSEIPANKLRNPMCPFGHDLVPVHESCAKSLGMTGDCIQGMCHMSIMDEKCCSNRKGRLTSSKRDILRQKSSFYLERNYKCVSKGTFRAKLTSWGSLVLDKKNKSSADCLSVCMKNTSCHHICGSTQSALSVVKNPSRMSMKDPHGPLPSEPKPTKNRESHGSLHPETKPTSKTLVTVPSSPKLFEYYGGIPFDKSLGKYVPQDEKDKLILFLVPQLQVLQKELHGWTDWANKKVMEAARRLGKDQAELKMLRQEKEAEEKFKKEKQILEENTVKRLSEMECALTNATGQVEMANSTGRQLEEENALLKKDLEVARLQALESNANLQEASVREQEAQKKIQSWDIERSLLQEEVSKNKCRVAELEKALGKAKHLYNQIEARCQHEEQAKERLLTELHSIHKQREQQESLAKAEEDMVRQRTKSELQKYEEDIRNLEHKLSELTFESETSKIAALRRGLNGSHGSLLGHQAPKVTKRLAVFRDNFRGRSWECVMCLTEEISVIFLPCAHQALCGSCNELHEKQGMKSCPSCRTPIKRRIKARFATP
ncbi:hypothetical protein NMG60_11013939 [Bertholletia excelsa]